MTFLETTYREIAFPLKPNFNANSGAKRHHNPKHNEQTFTFIWTDGIFTVAVQPVAMGLRFSGRWHLLQHHVKHGLDRGSDV